METVDKIETDGVLPTDKYYTRMDMRELSNQMENLFHGQEVAVYLVPSGGVSDWYGHRRMFTYRDDNRPRNVSFAERILVFSPYDDVLKRPGYVISDAKRIGVKGSRSVVIYDDIVKDGRTLGEAAYFLLINSRDLGFFPSFVLHTVGKIDYAGVLNLATIKEYTEWLGLRRFLEREAEKDGRMGFIYSELKNKNLLDRISVKPLPLSKGRVSITRPNSFKLPSKHIHTTVEEVVVA